MSWKKGDWRKVSSMNANTQLNNDNACVLEQWKRESLHHGKPSPPRHQNAIPSSRRRRIRSHSCSVRPSSTLHFTPFPNVRRARTHVISRRNRTAPRCTNLLSFSALLAIVKDKDTSFRRREVATRGDPSLPPPQNRKLPYHPWKPIIIIVIAHIIIAKKGKFNRSSIMKRQEKGIWA